VTQILTQHRVAGGGRGLGLAIARGCAELGANIAVLDVLEDSDEVAKLEEGTGIKTKYYWYVRNQSLAKGEVDMLILDTQC